MKKKEELRYFILLIFIVVAITLGLLNRSVNQNRKLNFIESMIKDSVLFVNNIFAKPFNFISDYLEDEKDKNIMLKEYQELKKSVDKIDSNNSKIIELENRIKELEELLELNKSLSNYTYLNAEVVNRNLGYWYNNITINKGSIQGVEIDMAVITNKGLIGKVTEVSNFNSVVKLLTSTDVNNKISVKIQNQDSELYGLFTKYSEGYLIIEGIDQNTDIVVGSKVVTTGMGGVFPSGILLGTVDKISSDHFDLAKTVYVTPSANFNNIKYVTVLKRSK